MEFGSERDTRAYVVLYILIIIFYYYFVCLFGWFFVWFFASVLHVLSVTPAQLGDK